MHHFATTRIVQPQRSSGFTLVEMLIVLAIVGILAAILLPVFASVRDASRRTVCASNLRQIGLAMEAYAQDNNRRYPVNSINQSPSGQDCGWMFRLEPYVKASKVFECPSADAVQFGATDYSNEYHAGCPAPKVEELDGEVKTWRHWGSYDVNWPLKPWVRDSSFKNPSAFGFVLDGVGDAVYQGRRLLNGERWMCGVPRHRNGANVLFADWHIKWLSHESMVKESETWTLDGKPYSKP